MYNVQRWWQSTPTEAIQIDAEFSLQFHISHQSVIKYTLTLTVYDITIAIRIDCTWTLSLSLLSMRHASHATEYISLSLAFHLASILPFSIWKIAIAVFAWVNLIFECSCHSSSIANLLWTEFASDKWRNQRYGLSFVKCKYRHTQYGLTKLISVAAGEKCNFNILKSFVCCFSFISHKNSVESKICTINSLLFCIFIR